MDQRWVELIEQIHREQMAEVIFRFPSAPARAQGFIVLSPEPGTDVGELARRVAEFLQPSGHRCVCAPAPISTPDTRKDHATAKRHRRGHRG